MEDRQHMDAENAQYEGGMKYCKFCGKKIFADAVVCTHCGRQVEELRQEQPNVIVNNNYDPVNENHNSNSDSHSNSQNQYASSNAWNGWVSPSAAYHVNMKNKWVALLLCMFLGVLGAHKFYEGKAGMGVLYLLTCGLFGIGCVVDMIVILFKPHYYPRSF